MFGKAMTGLAAIMFAVTCSGQSFAAANCSSKGVDQLGGAYKGQALGFRSEVTLRPSSEGGCRFNAKWQIFKNTDEAESGRMQLELADGELQGSWSNGTDGGSVRFVVRRQGQHLNGRISGIKGEPDGPWDLIKVVDKTQ